MSAPKLRAAALPSVLLVLWACGPKLEDARLAWQRDHPDSYGFEYQRNCACPGSGLWWRITVKDDSIVAAQLLDSSADISELGASLQMHPTISQMFDGIAAFAHHPHTWTRVHYDSRWHFPADARGDATDRTASGWHFYVRNFRPIP
jgi:uncharacterized protein DUF6174